MTKIPVEQLHEDDLVRAVEHGPEGRVIDADRYGWTIVQWPGAALPYEHDVDRLYLLEASHPNQKEVST